MPSDLYTWQFGVSGTQEATGLFSIIAKLDSILQAITSHEKTTAAGFRDLSNSFSQAAQSTRDLTTASDKSSKSLEASLSITKESSSIFLKYTDNLDKAASASDREASATSNASKIKETWFAVMTRAAGIWNTWNKAVDFAAKRIKQIGDALTFLTSKTQEVGGAFEFSEAEFRAYAETAGGSTAQIEEVIVQSEKLGRTTRFTAKESLDAAIVMVKAGSSVNDILRDQEGALKGAAAGSVTIAKSASIAAHGMKFFSDEMKNADDVLKVQIASAQAAEVDITQLDAALTRGGGAAQRAGVSFTRFNAAMALFAEKSILGGKAGNDFTRIITALTARTPAAEKALNKLGVSMTEMVDGKEQMRDIGRVFEDIKTSLQGLDFTEQQRVLKDLFGRGLLNSAQVFLEAGITGFDEMERKILNAAGAMQKLEEYKGETMINSLASFQSASEGVFVSLRNILKVPIGEFWHTLANILNIVTDRITVVAERFKDSGTTVQDWIDAIRGGGFEGIFEGIGDEIAPELETLKALAAGAFDVIKSLFIELWEAAYPAVQAWFSTQFPQGLEPLLKKAGETIGNALMEGLLQAVKVAAKNLPGILAEQAKGVLNFNKGFIQGGIERGQEFAAKQLGIGQATPVEVQVPQNIDTGFVKAVEQEVKQDGKKITDSLDDVLAGWTPKYSLAEFGGEQAAGTPLEQYMRENPTLTEEQAKKDLELKEYAKRVKEGTQKEYLERSPIVDLDEDELKKKKEILDTQESLIAAEKRQKEALEESTAIITKTQIEINNAGAAFEKWLLNPIDQFKQKLLGIREQFTGFVDSIRSKKVDIEEKFGLKTSEQANQQRIDNLKKSLSRDEEMLKLAQTPEEEMKIRERMAGRAEQLAGLTPDETARGQYAQQAADYLNQAEEAAMKGEELRAKQLEIEKQTAKDNLAEYEKLVSGSQTAGSRAGYLEQLKEAYMTLGPEYQEKAIKAQEDWKRARSEAAAEEAERFKRIAENSDIQVELARQTLEELQSANQTVREQSVIAEDTEGYAATAA